MKLSELCQNIGYDFYKAINGNHYSLYFDSRENKLWMIDDDQMDYIALMEENGLDEKAFDKLDKEKIWICTFEFGFETVRIIGINERFYEWEKYLELQKYRNEETLFEIDEKGEIIC